MRRRSGAGVLLNFDQETAYASALLLVLTAVGALVVSRFLTPRERT